MLTHVKKMTLGASVLALLAGGPAMAADKKTDNNPDKPAVGVITKEDINQAWDKTKQEVTQTADKVTGEARDIYRDLRGALSSDETAKGAPSITASQLDMRQAASSLIGKDVLDGQGGKVAVVDDIVIGRDGQPEKLILRDGGFFGFGGKLIAMDYGMMVNAKAESETILRPVGQSMLNMVSAYTPSEDSTSFRASEMMKAPIKDSSGKTLATVEDVVIADGQPTAIVASYDTTLGMGGRHALLSYGDLKKVRAHGKVAINLSAAQAKILKTEMEASEERM